MDKKSIHEFDVNLICEYFLGLERQGPGSPEVTLQALRFTEHLSDRAHIADTGCGTGGQTMVLAQNTPARITGIDIFPPFVDRLNASAKAQNVQDRVQGIIASMDDLPFDPEELDVIWSEGAIYNIGFKRGIQEWRKYLKKGGYIAVSEASWFTEKRPEEIEQFWLEAYPEIDTIASKVRELQQAGYIPVATFILPENCWIENFYLPQVRVQDAFLQRHHGNKMAEEFVAYQRWEAELYYRYKAYYGYAFYIGKKI